MGTRDRSSRGLCWLLPCLLNEGMTVAASLRAPAPQLLPALITHTCTGLFLCPLAPNWGEHLVTPLINEAPGGAGQSVMIHPASLGLDLSMVNQQEEIGLFRVILLKPDKFSTYPTGPIYRGRGCEWNAEEDVGSRVATHREVPRTLHPAWRPPTFISRDRPLWGHLAKPTHHQRT
jgi:hypothetical protein